MESVKMLTNITISKHEQEKDVYKGYNRAEYYIYWNIISCCMYQQAFWYHVESFVGSVYVIVRIM